MKEPTLVAILFKPQSLMWKTMRLGMTYAELTEEIEPYAIKNKVYQNTLVFEPPLPRLRTGNKKSARNIRPCLRCTKSFRPSHKFNRLCLACQLRASHSSPFEH